MGNFDPALQHKKMVLDNQIKNKEITSKYGWLSFCWGSGANAAFNIAGATAVGLLMVGVIFSFYNSANLELVKTFWQIISPFVGGAFGYLFGHRFKSGSDN